MISAHHFRLGIQPKLFDQPPRLGKSIAQHNNINYGYVNEHGYGYSTKEMNDWRNEPACAINEVARRPTELSWTLVPIPSQHQIASTLHHQMRRG